MPATTPDAGFARLEERVAAGERFPLVLVERP